MLNLAKVGSLIPPARKDRCFFRAILAQGSIPASLKCPSSVDDVELLRDDVELIPRDGVELLRDDVEFLRDDVEIIRDDVELIRDDVELIRECAGVAVGYKLRHNSWHFA